MRQIVGKTAGRVGAACGLLGVLLAVLVVPSAAQEQVDIVLARAAEAEACTAPSDAIVLLDQRRVTPLPDGRRSTRMHTQFLIRTEDGVSTHTFIPLLAYPQLQDTSVLYARTIDPTGEVVDHNTDFAVHVDGSALANDPLLREVTVRVLPMWDVKAGSVIDIEYTVVDRTSTAPDGEFTDAAYLISADPTYRFEYILNAPQDFDIHWVALNIPLNVRIQTASAGVVYAFSADNCAAIVPEVLMPSLYTAGPHLVLSTIGTWDDLAEWLWDANQAVLVDDPQVAERARSLVAGAESTTEMIQQIYSFVTWEVEYRVTPANVEAGMTPRPPLATLQSMSGDCKDKALLLVALLQDVGIAGYPVYVSGYPGFNIDWASPPVPYGLNHVVVGIPTSGGDWQILDPTCTVCTSALPPRLLTGKRWLLASPRPEELGVQAMMRVPEGLDDNIYCSITGQLSEEGDLLLHSLVITNGHADQDYRTAFYILGEPIQRDVFTGLLGLPNGKVVYHEWHPPLLEFVNLPVSFDITYELLGWSRVLETGLEVATFPYGLILAGPEIIQDVIAVPDGAGTRTYPIVVGTYDLTQFMRVDVGQRDVVSLPDDLFLANKIGSFDSFYWMDGSTIYNMRTLQIDVAEVPAEDYPLLTELLDAAVEAANQLITLRPSSEE
jgi:hypothetical protein